METRQWITYVGVAVHLAIQLLLSFRIIMHRRPVGESLAWLLVVLVLPVAGPLAYLLLGEMRLGRRRAHRFSQLADPLRERLANFAERKDIDWSRTEPQFESLARMCRLTVGIPAMGGNSLELVRSWQKAFVRIVNDIDAAQSTCHLEFYIWQNGGEADRVVEALLRARTRGVCCRILVDALGSRGFLASDQAQRLRDAGVNVGEALPAGWWRLPLVRLDLRMHRKIVVIDGRVAYTGSLNLVDPRYFKRHLGVGQWVDAMVRLTGPAVESLAVCFLADWYVESDDSLEHLQKTGDAIAQPPCGDAIVQALPSGPDLARDAVEQVLLTAIYSARRELVMTTPYFVPSESMRMALIAAARRGVRVVVVVPARLDSVLVRYASDAFRGELLSAGVEIASFRGGLLHTKSVTVDGTHCLFGSVNLDPRSFRLNFEILLAIYDKPFTKSLRQLQQSYIDESDLVDAERYERRSLGKRSLECVARLLSPLL